MPKLYTCCSNPDCPTYKSMQLLLQVWGVDTTPKREGDRLYSTRPLATIGPLLGMTGSTSWFGVDGRALDRLASGHHRYSVGGSSHLCRAAFSQISGIAARHRRQRCRHLGLRIFGFCGTAWKALSALRAQ
jgi:hypothetical protein